MQMSIGNRPPFHSIWVCVCVLRIIIIIMEKPVVRLLLLVLKKKKESVDLHAGQNELSRRCCV
jgi:hypothetical protein